MAVLVWDQTGKKYYETGVDKGVSILSKQAVLMVKAKLGTD